MSREKHQFCHQLFSWLYYFFYMGLFSSSNNLDYTLLTEEISEVRKTITVITSQADNESFCEDIHLQFSSL